MAFRIDQGMARAMNRRLVLNLLRTNENMSRVEIAAITGLSPATVTLVVGDLIGEGFLVEGQGSRSASGRRRVPLQFNYSRGVVIGFKVMPNAIECVLTDLSAKPLRSIRVDLPDCAPETVVAAAVDAVAELVSAPANGEPALMGIGLAIPGVIDIEHGVCIRSHRLDWENVPIAAMLAEHVHVPVWVDDDTNAYALAQHLFGLGRQHQTIGALAIGAGISCALIIEGALFRGAHGAAGKLGHSIFAVDGVLCECGRRGCLQAHFSEPAIVNRWRQARNLGKDADRKAMAAAAAAGDPVALGILAEAGVGIARHLGQFINTVDPEIIVVGGEAVAFGDALFGPLREALARHTLRSPPPILPDWEDDSWSRGAAALATQRIFNFEAAAGKVSGAAQPSNRLTSVAVEAR